MERLQKPGYSQKRMKMYQSVATLLGRNNSVTSTIPAFANSLNEFNQIVDRIKRTQDELSEKVKLKADDVEESKEELIATLLPVASALYTYGRKNNIEILKFDERDLRHLNEKELIKKATEIFNQANHHLSKLNTYGINDDRITRLQNKISKFELSTEAENGKEGKGLRAALYDYLHQADEMLEEDIDNFMELLREENPELYNDYQSARVVKDLGVKNPVPEEGDPRSKHTHYEKN